MIHKKEACEVKRVFKKNQIIIAALAVMIAVAGYLNYSGKMFHEKDGGAEEANADLANQELLDISEEDIETVGDEIASNDYLIRGLWGNYSYAEKGNALRKGIIRLRDILEADTALMVGNSFGEGYFLTSRVI